MICVTQLCLPQKSGFGYVFLYPSMKGLFITYLMLFSFGMALGQSTAKFNLKGGFAAFYLQDESDLADSKAHLSQHVGFDILIEENGGVFIPGFRYYRIGITPEAFKTSELFSNRPYAHYVKMPLSFGYRFKQIPLLHFTVYGGGNFTFFITVDENQLGLHNERFTGVQPNLHVGGQVLALNHFTLDLRYDHGLNNMIKTRKESKVRGLSLSLGLVF